jgi:uncharacterized damage-inducible protein DinB
MSARTPRESEILMQESHETIEGYLAACGAVQTAFSDMSHELMMARPVPGKWSAMEVLCHLVDTDLTTAFRIRTTLTSISPRLATATLVERSTVLGADARDPAEELALFQTIRTQTAHILRSLPADALDRQAVLVKPGNEEVTRTVRQFLTGITAHVRHHLSFVEEKRLALGLPLLSQ